MSLAPRILVFTGDGKGKTTAALGMAFRASGHGLRTCMIQFIKGDASVGEVLAAAGAASTGRALDERCVHTLVLNTSFVALQPEVAEVFVRSAISQDARIEVVAGDAARLLDESGGAGVLLRFSPFRTMTEQEGELAHV